MSESAPPRRALVTGAASGIGRACVLALRDAGYRTAGLDRDHAPDADVHALADVTDALAVEAAVDQAVAALDGLDVVVNCAGMGAVGDIRENPDEEWHRVFDVNVFGIVRVTRAAWPHLVAGSDPAVVNIGSIAGHAGLPLRAAYSASKGAVHALTLAMAADGLADGVRVNAVAPGTVDTPWVGRLLDAAPDPAAARAQLEQRQPVGRLGRPEEIAAAVVHLCDPCVAFVNGTILSIDGGMQNLRVPPNQTRV